MAASNRPRWEPEQAIDRGRQTLALLESHGPKIVNRLAAGLADGLGADIAALDAVKTGRPVQGQKAQAKTGTERQLAAEGAHLLGRLRELLKHNAEKGSPVLRAVGVGRAIHPDTTSAVVYALQAMVEASAAPEYLPTFRAAGILEADLAECVAIRDALGAADQAQKGSQQTARDLTAQMRATQKRIEDSVIQVSLAGQAEFRKDPATAARFAALLPRPQPGRPRNP